MWSPSTAMANYQPEGDSQGIARQEEGYPEPYRQFRFEGCSDDETTMRVYLHLKTVKEEQEQLSYKIDECLSLMRKLPAVARQLDPAVGDLQKGITIPSDVVDCPKDFASKSCKKSDLDAIEEEEFTTNQWTKDDSIELQKADQQNPYSAPPEKYNMPDPYETHEPVGDTGFAEASDFSTRQTKPSLPNPVITPVQEGQKLGEEIPVTAAHHDMEEVDGACAGGEDVKDAVTEATVMATELNVAVNDCDPCRQEEAGGKRGVGGCMTERNSDKTGNDEQDNNGRQNNCTQMPPSLPYMCQYMYQIYQKVEKDRENKTELRTDKKASGDSQIGAVHSADTIVNTKNKETASHEDQNSEASDEQDSKCSEEGNSEFSENGSDSTSGSCSRSDTDKDDDKEIVNCDDCHSELSELNNETTPSLRPDNSAVKPSTTNTDSSSGSQSLPPCFSSKIGQYSKGPVSLQAVPRSKPLGDFVGRSGNWPSLAGGRERKSCQMAMRFPDKLQRSDEEISAQNDCHAAPCVTPPVQLSGILPGSVKLDTEGDQLLENHVAKVESEDENTYCGEVSERDASSLCTGITEHQATTAEVNNFQNTDQDNRCSVNRTTGNVVLPELSPSIRKAIDSVNFTGRIDCGSEANGRQVYLNVLPASPDRNSEGDFKQHSGQGFERENIVKAEQEARVDSTSVLTLTAQNQPGSALSKPDLPALPAFHPKLFQQMMTSEHQRSNAQTSNCGAKQSGPVGYSIMESTPARQGETEHHHPRTLPTTENTKGGCKYPGVRIEIFHTQKCIVTLACMRPNDCVRDVYDITNHKVRQTTGCSDFVLVDCATGKPMDGGSYIGKSNIKAFVTRRF